MNTISNHIFLLLILSCNNESEVHCIHIYVAIVYWFLSSCPEGLLRFHLHNHLIAPNDNLFSITPKETNQTGQFYEEKVERKEFQKTGNTPIVIKDVSSFVNLIQSFFLAQVMFHAQKY